MNRHSRIPDPPLEDMPKVYENIINETKILTHQDIPDIKMFSKNLVGLSEKLYEIKMSNKQAEFISKVK
jgi:hypothetical protein